MPRGHKYSRILDPEKGNDVAEDVQNGDNSTTGDQTRTNTNTNSGTSTLLPAPLSSSFRSRRRFSIVNFLLKALLVFLAILFGYQLFPYLRYHLHRLGLIYGQSSHSLNPHITADGCTLDIQYPGESLFKAPKEARSLFVDFNGTINNIRFEIGSVYLTYSDVDTTLLDFAIQYGSPQLLDSISLVSSYVDDRFGVVAHLRNINQHQELLVNRDNECLVTKVSLDVILPLNGHSLDNITIVHPFGDFFFDPNSSFSFQHIRLASVAGSIQQPTSPDNLAVHHSGVVESISGSISGNITLHGDDTRYKVTTVSGKVDVGVSIPDPVGSNHAVVHVDSSTVSGRNDMLFLKQAEDAQPYSLSVTTVSGSVHAQVPYPQKDAVQLDLESVFGSVSVHGLRTDEEKKRLPSGRHSLKGTIGEVSNGSSVKLRTLSSTVNVDFE